MPKDTAKAIQKMVDQATAAGIKIPETIAETPESVPETINIVPEQPETVNINTETVTLPAEIELEPKTLTLVQQFVWNFDEIKTALASKIEKYTGLVVTDKNLKEMEKTQKEIAGLRIKIGKFKLETKHELEKPYQEFELQIKELVNLVASVEKPIVDQIDKYEVERKDRERVKIQGLINSTATECGLEDKYSSQIVIDEKWLNRSAKKKEVTEAIQMKVAWYLDIQSQERQAAEFKAQKIEMSKLLCQSLSAGLATPLTFEEIESRVEAMTDIVAVKSYIEGEVARRKEREERAAQAAIEKVAEVVAPPPIPSSPPVQEWPGASEYVEPTEEEYYAPDPVPVPTTLPPVPPPLPPIQSGFMPSVPPVELWNVDLHVSAITVAQAEDLKAYMTSKGLQYNFSGYVRSV